MVSIELELLNSCFTALIILLISLDFIPFLLGSIIGRGLRFALVGYLAKIFENQFDKMLKSKEIFYISIGLILVLIIRNNMEIKWICICIVCVAYWKKVRNNE